MNQDRTASTDSIPLPARIQLLEQNKGKIFYIDSASTITDTVVDGKKQLKVNGDIFISMEEAHFPQYLYTSLMKITVLKPSAFRINAYDADQGQSVESLFGELKILKNYNSPFPEPDTLHENNLYMINVSIDLSEKESLDDDQLSKWWTKVNESL